MPAPSSTSSSHSPLTKQRPPSHSTSTASTCGAAGTASSTISPYFTATTPLYSLDLPDGSITDTPTSALLQPRDVAYEAFSAKSMPFVQSWVPRVGTAAAPLVASRGSAASFGPVASRSAGRAFVTHARAAVAAYIAATVAAASAPASASVLATDAATREHDAPAACGDGASCSAVATSGGSGGSAVHSCDASSPHPRACQHDVSSICHSTGAHNNPFPPATAPLDWSLKSHITSLGGSVVSRELLSRLRVVGQLDKKFILAVAPIGGAAGSPPIRQLVIIDQHAVDERARLEAIEAAVFPPVLPVCAVNVPGVSVEPEAGLSVAVQMGGRPQPQPAFTVSRDGMRLTPALPPMPPACQSHPLGNHDTASALDSATITTASGDATAATVPPSYWSTVSLSPPTQLAVSPRERHIVRVMGAVLTAWGFDVRLSGGGEGALPLPLLPAPMGADKSATAHTAASASSLRQVVHPASAPPPLLPSPASASSPLQTHVPSSLSTPELRAAGSSGSASRMLALLQQRQHLQQPPPRIGIAAAPPPSSSTAGRLQALSSMLRRPGLHPSAPAVLAANTAAGRTAGMMQQPVSTPLRSAVSTPLQPVSHQQHGQQTAIPALTRPPAASTASPALTPLASSTRTHFNGATTTTGSGGTNGSRGHLPHAAPALTPRGGVSQAPSLTASSLRLPLTPHSPSSRVIPQSRRVAYGGSSSSSSSIGSNVGRGGGGTPISSSGAGSGGGINGADGGSAGAIGMGATLHALPVLFDCTLTVNDLMDFLGTLEGLMASSSLARDLQSLLQQTPLLQTQCGANVAAASAIASPSHPAMPTTTTTNGIGASSVAVVPPSSGRMALLSRLYYAGVRPRCVLRVLHSKACRGAVMFGDPLTLSECEALIAAVRGCAMPFQCAHGRPAMLPLVAMMEC